MYLKYTLSKKILHFTRGLYDPKDLVDSSD